MALDSGNLYRSDGAGAEWLLGAIHEFRNPESADISTFTNDYAVMTFIEFS